MYSFQGLNNPDNINDTCKYDYKYNYTDIDTCQICGLILKLDTRHWVNTEENYPICVECYSNLRTPESCWVCSEDFESRNELFNHLRDEDHMCNPFIYKFSNGEQIQFVNKTELDVFCSTDELEECDDFNKIDYESLMRSKFHTRKCFKYKFCIISQYCSIVITNIDNMELEDLDHFTNISFNSGKHNILLDRNKNIGWVQYRNNFIVPISSIILII